MNFDELWGEIKKRRSENLLVLSLEGEAKKMMHYCFAVGAMAGAGLLKNVHTMPGVTRVWKRHLKSGDVAKE